ncbi:hypothetical protein FDECE_8527 [Fusarium decemcellulare]|nr:hypothetical protein FDECE_8527 [Fusarium decemcellulare]
MRAFSLISFISMALAVSAIALPAVPVEGPGDVLDLDLAEPGNLTYGGDSGAITLAKRAGSEIAPVELQERQLQALGLAFVRRIVKEVITEGIKLIIAGIGAKEKQERFSQKTVNDIYTRANNPNVAALCAADFIFCGAQDTQCVWDKTGQTVGNVVFTCGVFNLPGSIDFNGQGGFANIAVRGRNCNNNANPNRYVCS